MERNAHIDEEIEKTLQSLDGIERANPKPFFLTRVEGRLSRDVSQQVKTTWAFRPAWVLASLGLVLALNVSAVLYAREQIVLHEEEQERVGLSTEWGIDANALDW